MTHSLLCPIFQIYFLLLLARIIMSWFPISPGGGLASVFSFLYAVTEPVLGPLRRLIPPLRFGGGMGIDLSPIIAFLVLEFVAGAFHCPLGL